MSVQEWGRKKGTEWGETVESFSLSFSWWLSPKMFPPAKESIIFEQKTTKGFFKLCDYITAIFVFVAVADAVAVAAAVVGKLVCRCRYGYWCRCKTICVHCTLSACTLYTVQRFVVCIRRFDFSTFRSFHSDIRLSHLARCYSHHFSSASPLVYLPFISWCKITGIPPPA